MIAVALGAYYLGLRGRYVLAGQLNSPYQMVLMANGQVYIGKLEGLGSAFPILTEVFYFQTQVDPQTKEAKAVLVKRGKEWHAPDRTILNAPQISVIELVNPDSALAKRLAELKAN
jgi:hypothetical protein